MAAIYVILALGVVVLNFQKIPSVFGSIFEGAFSPASVTGGAVGSFFMSMKKGVSRGIFSNEAGLGTGSIAHACADTKKPVKQGFFGIFEVFVDTIVICTLTALVILMQRCSGWIWRGSRSRTYYSWIYIHLWKLGIYLYSGCKCCFAFYDYRMGIVRNEMCGIPSWYKSE